MEYEKLVRKKLSKLPSYYVGSLLVSSFVVVLAAAIHTAATITLGVVFLTFIIYILRACRELGSRKTRIANFIAAVDAIAPHAQVFAELEKAQPILTGKRNGEVRITERYVCYLSGNGEGNWILSTDALKGVMYHTGVSGGLYQRYLNSIRFQQNDGTVAELSLSDGVRSSVEPRYATPILDALERAVPGLLRVPDSAPAQAAAASAPEAAPQTTENYTQSVLRSLSKPWLPYRILLGLCIFYAAFCLLSIAVNPLNALIQLVPICAAILLLWTKGRFGSKEKRIRKFCKEIDAFAPHEDVFAALEQAPRLTCVTPPADFRVTEDYVGHVAGNPNQTWILPVSSLCSAVHISRRTGIHRFEHSILLRTTAGKKKELRLISTYTRDIAPEDIAPVFDALLRAKPDLQRLPEQKKRF